MTILNPFFNDKPFIGLRNEFLGGTSLSGFNPRSLFSANEVGVWYDPSDVANLNWRYNLLTYTEQFDNAAWGKNNTTVVANAATAPNETTTAELCYPTTSGTNRRVIQYTTLSSGATYTGTIYVKAAGKSWVAFGPVRANSLADEVFFNVSTGVRGTVGASALASSITDVGNGWYRLSVTMSESATDAFFIDICDADGSTSVTASGTDGVLIWGAQLEVGSTASPYQRISDVNTEVRERFPSATLYQDSTGIAPVTTPGQTVGLMLDKSRGAVRNQLLVNGEFASNASGWTAQNATASVSAGQVTITNTGPNGGIYQAIPTVVGRTYFASIQLTSAPFGGGNVLFFIKSDSTDWATPNRVNLVNSQSTVQTYLSSFTATATTTYIHIINGSSTVNHSVTVDNASIVDVPGNHATQSGATSVRPIYAVEPATGRRNLLTFTEQFDNAVWSKLNGSISADAAVAPSGTTTADKFIPNNIAATHSINRLTNTWSSGGSAIFSCYVKADSYAVVGLNLYNQPYTGELRVSLNLDTLSLSTYTLGTAPTNTSATIEDVGFGWRRVTATATFASGTGINANILVNPTNPNAFDPGTAGNGTDGILIWGAQLETGSTATAYQRVVSQYDVTESGVASRHYLAFDGIDDWLQTSTITPGTDKAQVFAGVRKLSDAAAGIITEMSTDLNTNNGSLFIAAPHSNGFASYIAASKGTVSSTPIESGYPAPHTAVITALMDISAPLATLAVNRVTIFPSTTSQGTGNYLAYPLYIGRRAGTSLPFNGNLYGLIVRFGSNLNTSQISQTEKWLNTKTGAY